jgi:hypothetical protein
VDRPPAAGSVRRFRSGQATRAAMKQAHAEFRQGAPRSCSAGRRQASVRAAAEKLPCSAVRANDTRCASVARILNRWLNLIVHRRLAGTPVGGHCSCANGATQLSENRMRASRWGSGGGIRRADVLLGTVIHVPASFTVRDIASTG